MTDLVHSPAPDTAVLKSSFRTRLRDALPAPSILIGLFVYEILVVPHAPFIKGGFSGMAGAVGPTWIRLDDDVLRAHLMDAARRTLGLRARLTKGTSA